MKRLLVIAALATGAVACVGGDDGSSPVRLLSVGVLEGDATGCKPGDVQVGQGRLDISAGVNYLMGLNIASTLNETSGSDGNNDVTLTELVLRYTSQPSLSLPAEERVPLHFLIPAGSADGYLLLFAFGPQAFDKLQGSVVPGDMVLVSVTIQAAGHTGGGAEVKTNDLTFPIYVFNSGFQGCSSTTSRLRNGPCGQPGGQDGTQPACSTGT